MILKTFPRHLNLMIDFMVMKVASIYSMILARPFMRMAKVVLSTYHLVMKFPTKARIREAKGNRIMAHECYFIVRRGKEKVNETSTISLDNITE